MMKFFKDLFSSPQKRVYLDYAGATPVSARAKRALLESLALYGNSSAIHKEGTQAGILLDKARAMCAKVLNVHAYEIYFTGSGTESCNLAIVGTYLGAIKNCPPAQAEKLEIENSRPHIIVLCIEHPAVLEPIKRLEKENKISVTYIPVGEDGIVRVQDIREALTENTILVNVMYANNEIGTLQPVKEIGRMLEEWKKEQGRTHTSYPYFHIDACQASNYCNLDAVRLRAHLMTVNSSKVYGPKGIALLYKREGIIVEPILSGGGQERGLRSGTEDSASAYAFGIALEEAQQMKEKESLRLRVIRNHFKEKLQREIPEATMYGAWDPTSPEGFAGHVKDKEIRRLPNNINIRVPGITSEEMILRLDARGFACSHKSACASAESDGSYVIEALGASKQEALENIRVTLGRETTRGDMDRLVSTVKEIKENFVR